MHPLARAALLGTARQPEVEIRTGTGLDAVLRGLDDRPPERRLLLAAGLWSAYAAAGRVAPAAVPVAPAAEDPRPACPARVEALLRGMLAGPHDELLPEALGRVAAAGFRLPHALLPVALAAREPAVRRGLIEVLGSRGRWLAAFDPDHAWALAAPGALPPDADARFAGGTPEQRAAWLRAMRGVDAERGRGWVAEIWDDAKADERRELVGALEVGLGPSDEPFLEAALDDRAGGVRAVAAALLARVPGSALQARMIARADAVLGGGLEVRLPTALDAAAERDGIDPKAPDGVGVKAWWLLQIVARVPPAHWIERLGASPPTILAGVPSDEWVLVEGLSRAALAFSAAEWAGPLWDWWRARAPGGRAQGADGASLRARLVAAMPASEGEARAALLLNDTGLSGNAELDGTLAALPQPWSRAFGGRYLDALRRHVAQLDGIGVSVPWLRSVEIAARALPPEVFPQALAPWPLPEPRHLRPWAARLDALVETVALRQRIADEIPGR